MKKKRLIAGLFSALALFSVGSLAFASGYGSPSDLSTGVQVWTINDSSYHQYDLDAPAANAVYGWDQIDQQPFFFGAGDGIAITNGVIMTNDIPQSKVTDLVSRFTTDEAAITSVTASSSSMGSTLTTMGGRMTTAESGISTLQGSVGTMQGWFSATTTDKLATQSIKGFMSAADKTKLDGISSSKTYNYPTRTLGTAFQVSTTTESSVRYSLRIANTITLTGGAAGDVVLETADDSAFTTNVHEIGRVGNGNTGTLVIGLTLNDSIGVQIEGLIPAGKYARLRSITTTGTPTYTFLSGQEAF